MQQKIIIGLALTLVIVIFIPVYWAMEPGRQEAALNRQQAEAVERGTELYISSCATCHGLQGEGNIGPALKDIQLDDNVLEKTIARGVPGTAMDAWSTEDGGPLHQQQIKDLVAFIKNWQDTLPETPASIPPITPPTIAADELYTIRCAGCHGVNRQGVSGLGPALTPDSLRALSYTEIRDIILNGRSNTAMPPFKSALSQEEIDALVQLIKDTSP